MIAVCSRRGTDFVSGRNGGHLTPWVFRDFSPHATAFGNDEALRGIRLEQHTAAEIVRIIKEHKLESAVDLVEGGHIDLMFNAEEVADMRTDYEAAKAAGANVDTVRWMDEDEMIAVSNYFPQDLSCTNTCVRTTAHRIQA